MNDTPDEPQEPGSEEPKYRKISEEELKRILADADRDTRLVQRAQEAEGGKVEDADTDARRSAFDHELWIGTAMNTPADVVLRNNRERARSHRLRICVP